MNFKVILFCFKNQEYVKKWEQLMGIKLHENPKAIQQFIRDRRKNEVSTL